MTETKKNILTLMVTVVLSLLFIEGILRLFETQNYSLLSLTSKEGMTIYKPGLDTNIFDNENLKKVHIKINNLGFPGENFSEEKASDTLRVALLGDSFTAAIQVDYENSFPYLLNKKINNFIAASPSSTYKKAEVLNFGIGGMGTVDEMKYYIQYAQKFHPDIVILAFYLGNDTIDNSYNYAYKDIMLSDKSAWSQVPQYGVSQAKTFTSIKDRVYRKSAIIRFADRVVRTSPKLNALAIKLGLYRSPVKSEYGLDIPFWTYYYLEPLDSERAQYLKFSADLLTNLKKQLDKDGVKFGLIFIPEGMTTDNNLLDPFKADHPKIKDYNFNPSGMENKLISQLDPSVKILNLRSTMEKQATENKKMYMGWGGHFTEAGNATVAEALSGFIFNNVLK